MKTTTTTQTTTQTTTKEHTMNKLNTRQITQVQSAVNFAEAGFGSYRDIVNTLASMLEVTPEKATEFMKEEINSREV